jgi:uncharacterized membrane protein YkvA (DUF1232 family)
LLGGAAACALSPVDIIPDFIPIVGHLDDAIILPLLIWLALGVIPEELIYEHRSRSGQVVYELRVSDLTCNDKG